MKKLFILISCCTLVIFYSCSPRVDLPKDSIHPKNLLTESLINPLGIDVVTPRLSWELISDERNEIQSAYRIIVSSSRENLDNEIGDLWDTDKVLSDQSIHIKYEGKELLSGQECFWKIKSWDKDDIESDWSETAYWSMGILDDTLWKSKWIGLERAVGNDDPSAEKTKLSARYLRKEFQTTQEIMRATAYISGLGSSELYINGRKISDHVLSPGQTQFNKRSLYVVHDVTDQMVKGKNAIGVILGTGRFFPMRKEVPFRMIGFGYPKLRMTLVIEYSDNSTEHIITDETWKITCDGPITENNEFDGEKYDARKEMPGWNMPGFNESKWIAAEVVNNPSEKISAQMANPIRITEKIKAISISEPKPGMFIVDMGQNMVGWVKLNVNGKAGAQVKLRFAEVLKDDGTLSMDNLRSAEVTDIYTCSGKGDAVWEPRFTYHGFRFVEITGFPGKPDINTVEGQVVHDDVERRGYFECSSDMINSIFRNAVWGIRGNYRSWPTDCPQRDERMAWLGDRATGSKGESYIFDISTLYAKWMQDIGDSQLESGAISDVCPAYWPIYNDNVTWEGTPIILARMLYDQYGDFETIRKSYDFLKKWYVHMTDNYLEDGLMPRDSYGDWCIPPQEPRVIHSSDPARNTSGAYLGTSFFYYMTGIMQDFAVMLEKPDDERYFTEQAKTIKTSFNKSFFDETSVEYVNNTVTANIIAIAFKLVDEKHIEKLLFNIEEKTEVQHSGHIPVGLVGAEFLMRTLTEYGKSDLAYQFATEEEYPGWGYMVNNGATTIWELWNGNTANPAMNSGNHVMLLGDFNIWLFENLGGIKPKSPGFKKIEMKPVIAGDLTWVKASHKSPYGTIESNWKIEDGIFKWEVDVPVNTTAIVYIPASSVKDVKMDGKPVKQSKSATINGLENGYAIVEIGSGKYDFISSSYMPVVKVNERTKIPAINVSSGLSTEPVEVVLAPNNEGASVYYTLDGSEPDINSSLYKEAFILNSSAKIKAKAFNDGMIESFTVSEFVEIYDSSKNGWHYRYYEGTWENIPDFPNLIPKSSGKVNSIEDLELVKMREDYWAAVFESNIEIPEDGEYKISISSDDGSRLFIDGVQVINNDGIHGVMEKQATIKLEKGIHPVKIEFFEGNYGESLKLFISGENFPRQKAPRSMFFFLPQ